jgi:hypothetical protein
MMREHVTKVFGACPPSYIKDTSTCEWSGLGPRSTLRRLDHVLGIIEAWGYTLANSSDQNYLHYSHPDGSGFKLYFAFRQKSPFFWASYFPPVGGLQL